MEASPHPPSTPLRQWMPGAQASPAPEAGLHVRDHSTRRASELDCRARVLSLMVAFRSTEGRKDSKYFRHPKSSGCCNRPKRQRGVMPSWSVAFAMACKRLLLLCLFEPRLWPASAACNKVIGRCVRRSVDEPSAVAWRKNNKIAARFPPMIAT